MLTIAAFVLLAMPADAAAQFTTQAAEACPSPTTCDECSYGLTGKHRATMTMGSYGGRHEDCIAGLTCAGHPRCDIVDNAPAEKLDAYERMKEIINTMDGAERFAALLNEFPENVERDGGAVLVGGMLCDEGVTIARLLVADTWVAAL
jgi:hypothetical protein